MPGGQKTTTKNNNSSHQGPAVIPATEIARNPNPRANENVQQDKNDASKNTDSTDKVGSEITDGEDG
ncbi:MAG: hypothetical protein ACJ75B_10050 [Flavisolibacter sp.]